MTSKLLFILIIAGLLCCQKQDRRIDPEVFLGTWSHHTVSYFIKDYGEGAFYDTTRNSTNISEFLADGIFYYYRHILNDTVACYWFYNDVTEEMKTFKIEDLQPFSYDKIESVSKDKIIFKNINDNHVEIRTLTRIE